MEGDGVAALLGGNDMPKERISETEAREVPSIRSRVPLRDQCEASDTEDSSGLSDAATSIAGEIAGVECFKTDNMIDKVLALQRSNASKDEEIQRLREMMRTQWVKNHENGKAAQRDDHLHRGVVQKLQEQISKQETELTQLRQRVQQQVKLIKEQEQALASAAGASAGAPESPDEGSQAAGAQRPGITCTGSQVTVCRQEFEQILEMIVHQSRMALVEYEEHKVDCRKVYKTSHAQKQDLKKFDKEGSRLRSELRALQKEHKQVQVENEELKGQIERVRARIQEFSDEELEQKIRQALDATAPTDNSSTGTASRRNSWMSIGSFKSPTQKGTFDANSAKQHLLGTANNFSGKTDLGLRDKDLHQCVQQ
jgi:predicted  nucleic acid-binding Zn-ribbon protein